MTTYKSSKRHVHVKQLLSKMDPEIAASFTYKQRKALQKSISTRDFRNHTIDIRPTLALPFLPWSFYIVFLGGINKRSLTPTERFSAALVFIAAIFVVGAIILGLIFVILYLLKSWLGIDIFPNESMGIWDEFKQLW